MSKTRNMASLANFLSSEVQNSTDITFNSAAIPTSGVGTQIYTTLNEIPLSNNTTGDLAYIEENNRLYFWNGTGITSL